MTNFFIEHRRDRTRAKTLLIRDEMRIKTNEGLTDSNVKKTWLWPNPLMIEINKYTNLILNRFEIHVPLRPMIVQDVIDDYSQITENLVDD